MTNGPLYRKTVTPILKVIPKTCSKPMCVVDNPCTSCRNSTSRTKGLRAQRTAAKAMGAGKTAYRTQASNEENWRDSFRTEVKSGAQVNPLGTAFLVFERQSQQHKALGDPRPFRAVVIPDGWGSDGIVMLRISTWRTEVAPFLDDEVS